MDNYYNYYSYLWAAKKATNMVLPTSISSDTTMANQDTNPSDATQIPYESGGHWQPTVQQHTLGIGRGIEDSGELERHEIGDHLQPAAQQHTPGIGGGMEPGFSAQNSQSGPHKCERINPRTGQPCNT